MANNNSDIKLYCIYCGTDNSVNSKECRSCHAVLEHPTVHANWRDEVSSVKLAESAPRVATHGAAGVIASIVAFVGILVGIALFVFGGLELEGEKLLSVLDFFKFGEDGIWTQLFDLMGSETATFEVAEYLPVLLTGFTVMITVVVFLFFLIFGIVAFISSLRKREASSVLKLAFRTIAMYIISTLLMLMFLAHGLSGVAGFSLKVSLNVPAIAGLCAASACLLAALIFHVVSVRGGANVSLAGIVLSGIIMFLGVAVSVLAAFPTYPVERLGETQNVSMFSLLMGQTELAASGFGEPDALIFLHTVVGSLTSILLIVLGVTFMQERAFALIDEEEHSLIGGTGFAVSLLVISAFHLASLFSYAGKFFENAAIIPVFAIVFAVLSILSIVLTAVIGKTERQRLWRF